MINSKSKKLIQSNKALYKQKISENMGSFNLSNFRSNDFVGDTDYDKHHQIIGILSGKLK
jgi:translation initiation factor IF-2